jgi:hypothetical protein
MKTALARLAAGVLLAAIGWSQPLEAQPSRGQGVPPGSYLGSCTDVGVRANALIATCRRAGGGPLRTALAGVHQCTGDIGNNDGVLQCNFAGGAVARGRIVQGPGGGPPPPPGYGRDGYRDDYRENRRERCRELHQQAENLRAHRDWAWYPNERARFERRLYRVQEQQRELRCRY